MYKNIIIIKNNNGDNMKIKDIMSNKIISADAMDTIYDVSILMKKNNIGFIPVKKENEIIGIITDRDIVVKAISNKCDITDTIMPYITNKVISINFNEDTNQALELMSKNQIKRLIITRNNSPIGILSLSDIINNSDENITDYIKKIWQLNNNCSEKNTEIDKFYL